MVLIETAFFLKLYIFYITWPTRAKDVIHYVIDKYI
jgi:hypothetical protein